MTARLSAFVIWALVAASAVFWGLRLFVRAPAAPPHTVAAGNVTPQRADLTRLFGAPVVTAAPAPEASPEGSRFQLAGVVAPRRPGGPGIALIGIDGQAPRAFRIGATIDGELVLQSVTHRSVSIGPARGDASVVLELPPLPEPATGTLPPVAATSASPAPVVRPGAVPPAPPPVLPPTPAPPAAPGAPGALPGQPPASPEFPAAGAPRQRQPSVR